MTIFSFGIYLKKQTPQLITFHYLFVGAFIKINTNVCIFRTPPPPGRQTGVSQQAQKDTDHYSRKDGEKIEREAACHFPVSQEEAIFGCRGTKTGGRGDEKEQRDQQ